MAEATKWRVVGRIAGKRLPSKVVSLGRISLGPFPLAQRMTERVDAIATPSAETHFVGKSSDIRVSSKCNFWVDYQSANAIEATEGVSIDDALLLQVALSIRTRDIPYQVEVVCAFGQTTVESAFGAGVGVAFWHPEELTDEQTNQVQADLHFIETDDKARAAARALGEAIRRTNAPLRPAEVNAVLLGFFKVIELIANTVELETPADLAKKQEHLLDQLQHTLKSKKVFRKKVAAVRETAKKLARLELLFIGTRIDAVAERLCMSTEWRARAQEFVTLRNQRLGHAGREIGVGEIETWMAMKADNSAYGLARDFLEAYVDHRGRA